MPTAVKFIDLRGVLVDAGVEVGEGEWGAGVWWGWSFILGGGQVGEMYNGESRMAMWVCWVPLSHTAEYG